MSLVATAPRAGGSNPLVVLVRMQLRRERWRLLAWTAGTLVLFVSQGVSVRATYATQDELEVAARAMAGNRAVLALTGPARALDTVAGQVAWQASALGAVVAALMATSMVVRHTRASEAQGTDELLRAAPVARATTQRAALLAALVGQVVLGAALFLALAGYGLPVVGSAALAAGTAACGVLWCAVALVAAQVSTSPRAARGISLGLVGVAYLLRAVGDVSGGAASWASPIGWSQAMRPYAEERWWPLLLFVPATAAALGIAQVLLTRRDWGAGLVPARSGPAAGRTCRGSAGLAWRLHRGYLAAWGTGLAVTGAAYGAMVSDIDDMLGEGDLVQALVGDATAMATFIALCMTTLALLAGSAGIGLVVAAGRSERQGLDTVLLSGPVHRTSHAARTVAVAVVGSVAVLVVGVLAMVASIWWVSGGAPDAADLVTATLLQALGVTGMVSLAWSALGLSVRWASALAWLVLLHAWTTAMLGEVLRLPAWVRGLSALEQVPRVPVEDVGSHLGGIAVAGLLVVVPAVLGWFLLDRRDSAA